MKILTFDLPHVVGVMAETDGCQHNKRSKNSSVGPEQLILQAAGSSYSPDNVSLFITGHRTAQLLCLYCFICLCVREGEFVVSSISRECMTCFAVALAVSCFLQLQLRSQQSD